MSINTFFIVGSMGNTVARAYTILPVSCRIQATVLSVIGLCWVFFMKSSLINVKVLLI